MKTYLKIEDNQEYHSAICDHCGKQTFPSHKNPHLFFGFLCGDTKMFINNDCKEDYYVKKNNGYYGNEHRHKYSEMPVQVEWKNEPKFAPLYQEIIFDPRTPSQLLLFEL